MPKIRKKRGRGRLNILIMKPEGGVTTLTFSPTLLVVTIIFALIFCAASIIVMQRYFTLYFDHRDLTIIHQETKRDLEKLEGEYTYRTEVVEAYNEIMMAMNRVEPPAEADDFDPGAPADDDEIYPEALPPLEDEPDPAAPASVAGAGADALENWANLFPDPDPAPEHVLEIERLQVAGGRFDFNLVNQNEGNLAQGNILMVFAAETDDGDRTLIPYPAFDLGAADINFLIGPSYYIRSSKTVNGRITIPSGAKIVEMMVVGKARSGRIILKRKITPVNP
ncbi:hypothetical protein LJB86_01140 [Deltaproteobacteria bacterium OttesenSCG-928-M10]|nr:hypothetical protein [Deltaproteobacteria bacterium OttesenSCG-928-M10]